MNVEVSERNKDTDKQQRRERIKENRHGRKCEGCTTEEIPEYLGRKNVKENKMMARDLDVEQEATQQDGEERRCRMCYEERERDH
jgi:hypothetical protein